MGLFDKIKNALFEEEYVEVEEKPKAKTKTKRDKPKKEVIKDNKPIAKKIVLPNKEENNNKHDEAISKIDYEDPIDEDFDVEPLTNAKEKNEFKFPVIEDKDLKVENNSYSKDEPEIVRVIEDSSVYEKSTNNKAYQGKKNLYGINEDSKINVHEYGLYEKKEERKTFKPSPIISPIYGVLDKNYKKEEIVSKKEVRLTSSYARENLSVDDVRNKAYGTLTDDIAREIEEDIKPEIVDDSNDDSNLLVDLSSDEKKPEVHEVTMGDALEYFQDLGLEYNVDYKDASKEKATGRRTKAEYDEDKGDLSVQDIQDNSTSDIHNEEVDIKQKNEPEVEADDNLFDLIDSMYEEENKE